MNDCCFLITYLIIFSALFFNTVIAKSNIYINKQNCMYYVYISRMIMVFMLCDLVRYFCFRYDIMQEVLLVKISSFIIFALLPVAACYLFLFIMKSNENKKINLIFKIICVINIIINILGLKYGLIFKSDEDSIFTLGPLYIVESLTIAFFLIFFAFQIKKESKFNKKSYKYYIYIFTISVLGVAIETINYKITIEWLCVAVSIIMYYIIFCEKNFRFDALTSTKNRNAFENDMAMLSHKINKAVIVVLDLNGLKHTNDTKGHDYGDNYICQAANIIKLTFNDIGDTYRIGGDEFCVICPYKSDKSIENILSKMKLKINKYNIKMNADMSIAYGFAVYHKMRYSKISPYDVFKQADKNMYEMKNAMKIKQEEKVKQ